MKQLTLTTVLVMFFFSQNCYCQYQSIFGSETTKWNFITLWCDAAYVQTLNHDRDTLIDNVEYNIINDVGLMRETDNNSKLWFRGFDNPEETLMMDLELSVGDTFVIGSVEYEVDSVFVEDGRRKVEFDLTPPNCGLFEKFQFVEGFGPNQDFRYVSTGNEFFMALLRCHTRDSVTVNILAELGVPDNCDDDLAGTENIFVGNLDIHPNPTSGELIIDLPEVLDGRLIVRSLTGQVVYTQDVDYTEQLKLDLYRQDTGMYVIEVVSESGETFVEKIILH